MPRKKPVENAGTGRRVRTNMSSKNYDALMNVLKQVDLGKTLDDPAKYVSDAVVPKKKRKRYGR